MSAELKGKSAKLLTALSPHVGKLRRYLFHRLRGPQDIEDVMQEIWLRLLRNDPAAIDDPLAYVLRIARNVTADTMARAIAERQHVVKGSDEFGRAAETIAEPSTANLAERLINERELDRAVNELPETHARVLGLQLEGLSYAEIAAQLRLSVHTVEKYLWESKAILRTRLIK